MASGNIKGITIEIGGDTAPLNKALEGSNKTSRDLQSELKQVEKLLKLDPTNTELLAQKQKLLADSVDNTKNKLNTLKDAEKQVQQQFKEGKISEEQYRAFQREVASTEIKMNKLENQGKQTNEALSDEKPLNNLKNIGIAAGAAVAAAGAAFAGMASAVMENADELQRQSDVTGLSAERLQELQYAGNNLGVELDTVTGAQAKLTKSMAAAQDGTGAQAEAFKKLHISVTDSSGQLKSAETVMSEAFTALKGVGNETERDALAMQIFGKSAMELNPLIKAGGDELNRLAQEARDSGAVMSNEAVAGLDTFGDTLDNIKNSIMGAFGEALGQLIPKIQELIANIDMEKVKASIQSFATALVNILSFIMNNGSTIISIVAGIAAGMVAWNVATMINGVVTAIKAFKAADEGAATAQLALNAAQNANPIMLIVTLIAALVAAIIILWNTNEDFRNAVTLVWEAIKDMVGKAIEAITKVFWKVIDFIKDNWQSLLLMIVNPFAGAFKLLYDNCEAFRNFVNGFVEGIIKFFKETIPNFIKEVIDWFKDIPDKMVDIGKNIIKGIWEGIKSSVKWIKDKITGFAGDIVGGFKNAFGIHSPSKVLADEVGKYMAQGISVGFENEMDKVSSNIVQAANFTSGVRATKPDVSTPFSADGNTTLGDMYVFQQGSVVIDAKNVREFNDVTNLIKETRPASRVKVVTG
ncbi:MAG: hypothetical protein K0R50_1246 [Eubacterium sp.]|jgi:phage-related minor tail protein|nr:hypothetical protein [Eubacterium sp.]